MGSSISAIYDRHDTYKALCKELGVKSLGVRDDFDKHASELIKNLTPKQKEKLKGTYMYNCFKDA